MSADDSNTRRILDLVADGAVSQRALCRDLGIALGLTNLLVRRVIARGWVRIVGLGPNRLRYVLTPAGLAEKARLSRTYFLRTVRSYVEARDRVQRTFEQLHLTADGSPPKVVFYGSSEIAEVCWVCLQRTSLQLIAVIDDAHAGEDFFGLPVLPTSVLAKDRCDGQSFDQLVVTAVDDGAELESHLQRAGIDRAKVIWL